MPDKSDEQKLTFEDSLRELEQIAGDLESGRLGLSDALKRYEQGMGFLRHCHEAAGRRGTPNRRADSDWMMKAKSPVNRSMMSP